MNIINKELAEKVLQTVDCGLSQGMGVSELGKMCIEAAVNFAMDLPHGDTPICVGSAVRQFEIELNDANWSSEKTRANGLRKNAIAQLGSDQLNQIEFAERMAIRNTQIVLTALFYKLKMDEVAKKCEIVKTIPETIDAAEYAAEYAKYAAKYSAKYAVKSAEYAEYTKYAAEDDPDYFFKLSAQVCLDVLIEMKSPGCEFLYLTETL